MNLVILEPQDLPAPDRALLSGRRFAHISQVHDAAVGDTLRVGLLGGAIGTGLVLARDAASIELRVEFNQPPPPPLPLTLILALPRPKQLKRTLQHATALGAKKIYLINSYRVEKSYWQSPWLAPDKLHEQALLGLEQAVDTVLPQIELRKRFKPFVEDELPAVAADSLRLVAHPVTHAPCPVDIQQAATLAIGPEGGFIPYEIEKLKEAGFEPVHLGPRILRVETALPVLLGRLYPGC